LEGTTGLQGVKIALLIDFDNVILGVEDPGFDVELVVNALRSRGHVVMGRAYGDWYRHNRHRRKLMEQGIELVETPVFGPLIKNSADIRIVLDAFEIAMLQTHIDAFCLVSGDSDFLPLIKKLQYLGKQVIVIAGNKFTSDLVRRNCNEFISYENLLAESVGATEDTSTLEGAFHLLARSITTLHERGMEVRSSTVKQMMLQLNPAFSERNFGCNQFKQFLDKAVRTGLVKLGNREPVSGEFAVLLTSDEEADAALAAATVTAPVAAAPSAPSETDKRRSPAAPDAEPRTYGSRNGRRGDRRFSRERHTDLPAPSPGAETPQPALPDLPVDESALEAAPALDATAAETTPETAPEPGVETGREASNGRAITTSSLLNRTGLRKGRLRFSGKSGRSHRDDVAGTENEAAPSAAAEPVDEGVEQPLPEQVLAEQATPEQPLLELPLTEQPSNKQPVAEQPAPGEEPVAALATPDAAEDTAALDEQPALEAVAEPDAAPAPKKRTSRGGRRRSGAAKSAAEALSAAEATTAATGDAAPELPQPEASLPEAGGVAEAPADDTAALPATPAADATGDAAADDAEKKPVRRRRSPRKKSSESP